MNTNEIDKLSLVKAHALFDTGDEDVEVVLNGLSNDAIHLVGKMFSKPQNKELIEAVAEALLLKEDVSGVKRLNESEVFDLLKV